MTTQPITTEQMLADLSSAFPRMWKKPLCDFDRRYAGGVWTGQDTRNSMPDGEPMFAWVIEGVADRVHPGFVAWLSARRWYAEAWDTETWFLLPEFAWADDVVLAKPMHA